MVGTAIWLAPDNRRTVVVIGSPSRSPACWARSRSTRSGVLLTDIDRGTPRDAAESIWGAFFGDLHRALILFGVAGAVTTAAGSSLLRRSTSPCR